MLLKKVRASIERYGMFVQGDRVVVAVSGGVDSVVLLDVLGAVAAEYGLALHVAHLDHGLREASARDARFVAEVCAARRLPVTCERVDVRAVARERRLGLEEAGHVVRRDFLERVADRVGAQRIAVGHTLDDRAETLLFHLVRGAGPSGLVGIRPVSGRVVRPLIGVSRDEVLEYARKTTLTWREDETNEDLRFARNLLRHRVLPLLEELNPRLVEGLGRTGELLREQEEALEALLDGPWGAIVLAEAPDALRLDRRKLSALPRALCALLLRRAVAVARGGLEGITHEHLRALRDLAAASGHGELRLPGLVVRADAEGLAFGAEAARSEGTITETPVDLGVTPIPDLRIRLSLALRPWDGATPMPSDRDVGFADAQRIRFPLVLRGRRPGDRFSPLGLSGNKRLKDFLIDEKIPYYDRETLPLLCDRERIVWVVGVRLSDAVRVTPQTRQVLVMRREAMP